MSGLFCRTHSGPIVPHCQPRPACPTQELVVSSSSPASPEEAGSEPPEAVQGACSRQSSKFIDNLWLFSLLIRRETAGFFPTTEEGEGTGTRALVVVLVSWKGTGGSPRSCRLVWNTSPRWPRNCRFPQNMCVSPGWPETHSQLSPDSPVSPEHTCWPRLAQKRMVARELGLAWSTH